jgi:SNF2 family DNA or RNA helicase
LVVVPLSTVEHWRREFEGWTDIVCCIYHDRQRVWRDVLREYEWYYEDRPHTADYLKFDVLVTTYDTLIGDFDVISQIPFRVSVVDEAHRLRNQKGKLLECMKEISAKGTLQYGYQSRVLMSGTPLQNDLNVSAEICLRVFQLSRPQYLTCSAAIRNFRNCGHS